MDKLPHIPVLTIIAITVVGVAVYVRVESNTTKSFVEVNSNAEQTATPTATLTPDPTPTNTPSPSISATSSPTKTPVPSTTSSPSHSPSPSATSESTSNIGSLNLDSFKYPGANISSSSSKKLSLESTDDPGKITDWYKDKIKSYNFNVKSFVTTSTNSNVQNKLVAAKGDVEVRVEVLRNANSATSKIIVELL